MDRIAVAGKADRRLQQALSRAHASTAPGTMTE
jgi:hypothetical protein